jgi:hypothetical protein
MTVLTGLDLVPQFLQVLETAFIGTVLFGLPSVKAPMEI